MNEHDAWLDSLEKTALDKIAEWQGRLKSIRDVRATSLEAKALPPKEGQQPKTPSPTSGSNDKKSHPKGLQQVVVELLPVGSGLGMTRAEVKDKVMESGFKSGGKNLYQNVSATLQRLKTNDKIGSVNKDGIARFYRFEGSK